MLHFIFGRSGYGLAPTAAARRGIQTARAKRRRSVSAVAHILDCGQRHHIFSLEIHIAKLNLSAADLNAADLKSAIDFFQNPCYN